MISANLTSNNSLQATRSLNKNQKSANIDFTSRQHEDHRISREGIRTLTALGLSAVTTCTPIAAIAAPQGRTAAISTPDIVLVKQEAKQEKHEPVNNMPYSQYLQNVESCAVQAGRWVNPYTPNVASEIKEYMSTRCTDTLQVDRKPSEQELKEIVTTIKKGLDRSTELYGVQGQPFGGWVSKVAECGAGAASVINPTMTPDELDSMVTSHMHHNCPSLLQLDRKLTPDEGTFLEEKITESVLERYNRLHTKPLQPSTGSNLIQI